MLKEIENRTKLSIPAMEAMDKVPSVEDVAPPESVSPVLVLVATKSIKLCQYLKTSSCLK